MNSYRLNGMAGHFFRRAICKHFGIKHTEIYKHVKDMSGDYIIMKDGSKYVLLLGKVIEK